ncbi:MAG: hypothetical protein KJZ93_04900 [Caldilineaceae bacterium]|nr:hypothetical protein [Caldilineaceae bacterium]
MVRNETISAELTGTFQRKMTARRWDGLEQMIGLPTTAGGFALVLGSVVLLGAMMTLLVMTSVQTFQLRQQIASLEQQHRAVERQNAEFVWQISQHTSLAQIHRRAAALGYEAPVKRHYVTRPALTQSEAPAAVERADVAPSAPIPVTQSEPAANPELWDWVVQQFNQVQRWWQF